MRSFLTLAAIAAGLAFPGSALAAKQTVDGKGDITKMKVVNGDKSVSVALFGLEELCGGTRQANVEISWGTKAGYEYDGICPHGEWGEGIFYYADHSAQEGKSVNCAKLNVRFARGAVRIRIPRSCISKAADRIRVKAKGHNFGTLQGGEAGPTKRLRRG